MANVYVRSGAAGAGTGADWANAFTTLAAAAAAKAAGDIFWVSEDQAETQASAMTITFPGTIANPNFVYCVNHGGSVPPVSADLRTTATVTTTGTSNLTINGSVYCYGVAFSCGTGIGNSSMFLNGGSAQIYEACGFALAGTSASAILYTTSGAAGEYTLWKNCTVQFGATGQVLGVRGRFVWKGTSSAILGATLPTNLLQGIAGYAAHITVEGVDLSALGSGKTLWTVSGATNCQCYFKDCKLGASVAVAAAPNSLGQAVFLVRCDSGATNYRSEAYLYNGTETTETTIVRTGGASDGTTAQSRKIATTANSKWVRPFEALPVRIWNDGVSRNVTVTLSGTWNQGAVPNNDDIWLEVEYLGSSSSPQGSFANNTKSDNLAASAALPADAVSVWGGGGSGAGWSPFTLTVTLNSPQPLQRGYIYLYVKAAKASSTFYIDPQPQLS